MISYSIARTKMLLFLLGVFNSNALCASVLHEQNTTISLQQNLRSFYSPDLIQESSFEKIFETLSSKKYELPVKKFINTLAFLSQKQVSESFSKDLVLAILVRYFPFESLSFQGKQRYLVDKKAKTIVDSLDEFKNFLDQSTDKRYYDDVHLFFLKQQASDLYEKITSFSLLIKKVMHLDRYDFVETMMIIYQRLFMQSQNIYTTAVVTDDHYDYQQQKLMEYEREILFYGTSQQKRYLSLIPIQRVFSSNQGEGAFYRKIHSRFAENTKTPGRSFKKEEWEHLKFYLQNSVSPETKDPSHLFEILVYLRERLKNIKPLKNEIKEEIDQVLSVPVLLQMATEGDDYKDTQPFSYCIKKLESWGSTDMRQKMNVLWDKPHKMENMIIVLIDEMCRLGALFQDFMVSSYSRIEAIAYEKEIIRDRIKNFEINFDLLSKDIRFFIEFYVKKSKRPEDVFSSKTFESFLIDYVKKMLTDESQFSKLDDISHMFFSSKNYISNLSEELKIYVQKKRFFIMLEVVSKSRGIEFSEEKIRDFSNRIAEVAISEEFFTDASGLLGKKIISFLKESEKALSKEDLCYIKDFLIKTLGQKDPVYYGMLSKLGQALDYYLRKGSIKDSFLSEKDLLFKKDLESVFLKVLEMTLYFHDVYKSFVDPYIKDISLEILVDGLKDNRFCDDDSKNHSIIVESKKKIFRIAMLSQAVTYVRRLISYKSVFLGENTVTDAMVEDVMKESFSKDIFELEKKVFLENLESFCSLLFVKLLEKVSADSQDLSLHEPEPMAHMIRSLEKNMGTRYYYKYIFKIFRERLVLQSDHGFEDVVLGFLQDDLKRAFSQMSDAVFSYIKQEGEIEGLCRRYEFMRAGFR